MPTQVQFRRGTTAQNNSFTGAAGEISINTSNNTIRVHDGVTAGGFELAKFGNISLLTTSTSAQLATLISDETGTGNLVFSTSPTLVTPALGTPSAIVLTNASGTANNLTANIANFINVTDDTSTNATRYLIFANGTSGAITEQVSSSKLTFNPSTGQLTATDLNSSSDKRLKKNIKTVTSALDTVGALRGVTFEWKEGNAKSIGLIAQEVKEVLPEIVSSDENGYLGIRYSNMVGILVEAIKELKADFEAYKKTHP